MFRYKSATVSHVTIDGPRDSEREWPLGVLDEFAGAVQSARPTWRPGRSGAYRFEPVPPFAEAPPGAWLQVSGPGLDQPIQIRINRDGSRYVVTALVVGTDGTQEVTSETLRRIRLAEIMRELFKDFDPTAPPPTPHLDADGRVDSFDDDSGFLAWWLFKDEVIDNAHPVPGGSGGSQDARYQAFARTYLRELVRQPRRAMTNASEAHNISRATANRWAAICRERGYLPPREGTSDG